MRARLKRNIDVSSSGMVSGRLQRHHFSVVTARGYVVTSRNNLSIFNHDTADRWVGAGTAQLSTPHQWRAA